MCSIVECLVLNVHLKTGLIQGISVIQIVSDNCNEFVMEINLFNMTNAEYKFGFHSDL